MKDISHGRYHARFAQCDTDILAAQNLRHRAFGLTSPSGRDQDDFDKICQHVLIHDTNQQRLVCCFRILLLDHGAQIDTSYSAQYYNLTALHKFSGKLAEIGRFCMDPSIHDPDVLRVAWAFLTTYVDDHAIAMLFGCTSFHGLETGPYFDTFALLRDRYIAPNTWAPQVKSPDVFKFAARLRRKPDMARALKGMPPLLRTYLMMGGWVSDHAVIDAEMATLHVFTGVEIATIPPARKRLLRALA